ncbi:MAG: selenium metabolism-associated LysR family transcriptional regulator [Thermodesulfovibrionales bacterium]|nr:selenium metabolism-associated LysR family transcriptional regulator [Thermodesulfovibrionales bacterium]
MDIHQLKVFLSVFKNRSFSKASDELHLTQPTVSDHIKSLEEELNCRLFDRLGRTIIPTAEARILHNYAIEIMEKMEEAKSSLKKIKKQPEGELVIGASTIPGTYILPGIIKTFRELHTRIEFKLFISDSKGILDKVLSHELFLGIVGAKLTDSKINHIPFGEDELILVASPDLVKKSLIRTEDLKSLPFVLREEGSGTRKVMEKMLHSEGMTIDDLKIAGIFGSTEAVKEAVKAGLGVAILSRVSVKDEISSGNLKEIKIQGLEFKRRFYIIFHKRRSLPYQYKVFLDYLNRVHTLEEGK